MTSPKPPDLLSEEELAMLEQLHRESPGPWESYPGPPVTTMRPGLTYSSFSDRWVTRRHRTHEASRIIVTHGALSSDAELLVATYNALPRLIESARLALTLQRRVEELEARLGVVERASVAGLFNGLDAVSCEVLLTVANGARALLLFRLARGANTP